MKYVIKSAWKRACLAVFDTAGWLLTFPSRLLARPLKTERIKKILVIRLDHLGDVVMTRPALYALWKKFPDIPIDVMLSGEQTLLFDDEKFIRHLIPVTSHWFSKKTKWIDPIRTFFRLLRWIRKNRYDLILDFRGDLRHLLLASLGGARYRLGYGRTGGGFLITHPVRDKKAHQVLLNAALLEPLGISSAVENPPFSYSGERKRRFWTLFGDTLKPNLPLIVLHPGAGYPSKRWPAAKYRELVQALLESGKCQIAVIGTDQEKKEMLELFPGHPNFYDWRGKTHLSDLPVLLEQARLYIGNDSGPAHIAAAQGTEIILIASGTNDYSLWHPWSTKLHQVHREVPCSPCEEKQCPQNGHLCMDQIEVAEVLHLALDCLTAKGTGNAGEI